MRNSGWAVYLWLTASLMLLAGCGGGSGNSGSRSADLVGVWALRSIKINDQPSVTCNGQMVSADNGLIGECDAGQTFTFYANGILQTYNGTERGQGTWRLDGSRLTVSAPSQTETAPVAVTISLSGDQFTATYVYTSASERIRFQGSFQRLTSQPPPYVPVSNSLSGFGSSGGMTVLTPAPVVPRTLADYAGTWNGTWTTAENGILDDLQTGRMTLTFDASGKITGQIVNATAGQTYPVMGDMVLNESKTWGTANVTYPLGNGQPGSFPGGLFLEPDGTLLVTFLLLPPSHDLPGAPPPPEPLVINPVTVYCSLSRQ